MGIILQILKSAFVGFSLVCTTGLSLVYLYIPFLFWLKKNSEFGFKKSLYVFLGWILSCLFGIFMGMFILKSGFLDLYAPKFIIFYSMIRIIAGTFLIYSGYQELKNPLESTPKALIQKGSLRLLRQSFFLCIFVDLLRGSYLYLKFSGFRNMSFLEHNNFFLTIAFLLLLFTGITGLFLIFLKAISLFAQYLEKHFPKTFAFYVNYTLIGVLFAAGLFALLQGLGIIGHQVSIFE